MSIITNLSSVELIENLGHGDSYCETESGAWFVHNENELFLLNKSQILKRWDFKKKEDTPITAREAVKKIDQDKNKHWLPVAEQNYIWGFEDGVENNELKYKDLVEQLKFTKSNSDNDISRLRFSKELLELIKQ